MGLDWFEQLLESMFRPKEDKEDATEKAVDASPALVLACQQIVDCLVESVSRRHFLHFLHFPDHNSKGLGAAMKTGSSRGFK